MGQIIFDDPKTISAGFQKNCNIPKIDALCMAVSVFVKVTVNVCMLLAFCLCRNKSELLQVVARAAFNHCHVNGQRNCAVFRSQKKVSHGSFVVTTYLL